jgi:hypothetical protein
MDYLIAPTLFKNKTCRLPGIGTLSVITTKAENDFANSLLYAPAPFISFAASQEDENIFNEFTALSELIKRDLDSKGSVIIQSVGSFIVNEERGIDFIPLEIDKVFTQPVVAKRVIREAIEHPILVGDKETTNFEMSEYFVEEKKETEDNWWIWAIVLGIVGLGLVVYYILEHGFNLLGDGMKY